MASTTLYDDPWTSRWIYHALGMGDRTFHWVGTDGDRKPGCHTVGGRPLIRHVTGRSGSLLWNPPQGLVLTLEQFQEQGYLGKYPMCPHCLFLVLTVGGVPGFPAVDHAHFWV